jgi:hypothetical protein
VTAQADTPLDAIRIRASTVATLTAMSTGDSPPGMLEVGARDHRSLPGGDIRGDSVWAYAELLEALVLASQWEPAIRQADANADRFARAVRLRAQDVLNAKRRTTWPAPLAEAATLLADLATPQPARDAAALLARVALPVRQTELFQPSSQTRAQPESYERGSGPPPAALVIEHRGEPIMRPTPLTPGAMHQLEIEARLATWPDNAEELAVDFLTVHPPEYLYVGPVTFHPDRLRQPLEIRIAGERPPDAPPLQVTARASLRSGDKLLPARLVGNTTLELVTFDPGTAIPRNLPTAARRLMQMMGELRNAIPDLPNQDREDLQALVAGVLRFAHTALNDHLDAEWDLVDEAWFQGRLAYFLRADPRIGARLQEHTRLGGGITDLLLGNIVLELKVEKDRPVSQDDARRYAAQTTQYASGNDTQVSLLAMLDVSRKQAPAGVMGNELFWVRPQTASGEPLDFPSMVGAIIIRGNFPRPSDFSR